jgi:hypothetical protein
MPVDQPFRGDLTAALESQFSLEKGMIPSALSDLLPSPSHSVPIAAADDRTVWQGLAHDATLCDIVRRAEADLGTAWGVPLASQAARVHRDGNRDQWEGVVFAREHRLSRAAVAAAVTLDDRWVDEVADGIVLLCEQSSWCWPAHDDTRSVKGSVLATVTAPFLDLGAGEVVAQLAYVDQLLGTQLDARYPGLRARMRHEARTRVFEPFVTRRDWHWLGLDGDVHNWNPWIHGNVLVAGLRFIEAPADRAGVVALAIEGLDRYITALPADGAIDEGYEYWWNGACRALEAVDVLAHATGTTLDLVTQIPALLNTVAFPHRMHLGGDWYVNLADGQARPSRHKPWHALHRAARRAGDVAAESHAASYRVPGEPVATEAEGLGRLLRGITDPDWIAASPATKPASPTDVWLASTQVLVARETSTAGLTLVAKGGNNAEHHNHNDVGSFIVASGGVPVIVDAGRPTYTLATFGPDRYSIWSMQSTWHNVPEICGTAQATGAGAEASDVLCRVTESMASLSLELAAAYPVEALRSWRRTMTLDRVASQIVISDVWALTAADHLSSTVIHLLIAGDVHLGDATALVQCPGDTPNLRLRWPAGFTAKLTERPLDDPMLSHVWGNRLIRLDIDVTGRESFTIVVEQERTAS